jgi:hypothetical protein
MLGLSYRYVIARESNVVRVDFSRNPDPPAPLFPGAGALPLPSRVSDAEDYPRDCLLQRQGGR